MLFSIYPPWHLLLHSTCSFHANCLTLPRLSEVFFFSLWLLLFCQILFKWSLSFPVSLLHAHFLMTLLVIQKAYLKRKKIRRKKNNFYYSRFLSHFKMWYSIHLGDFLSFQKWILIKPQYEAVKSPFTFLCLNLILCKKQSVSCPELMIPLEYK